ncbi:polysaccharide deacetylase family protein [Nitrogeniibacter mangrovi]|uniref:Polysaccharide deacetylase family protein n=1 Tax=Nitrogeniibacter mangrovi TaxID=2016596 RepID=A0A6C1B730_9RHOO|nr:polysaccharide deacetylase family protein [Nitrogeniibacter mangrovi]QID18538.1 polysaccharide deacetylase family protein [Nitrogeniibacter mangrovi]
MSEKTFHERLDFLERAGYRVLPLDEAIDRHRAGTIQPDEVAVTIDDGWRGTGEVMLPEFVRRKMPATLYVTTYYVANEQPVLNVLVRYLVERWSREQPQPGTGGAAEEERRITELLGRLRRDKAWPARARELSRIVEELGVNVSVVDLCNAFRLMTSGDVRAASEHGIDVQLHTHTHSLHDQTAAPVRREIATNRQVLADMLSTPEARLRHFCYPSGVYSEAVFPVLRELNVRSATTTEVGINPPGAHPYALKRILDCESMSEIELEAHLSGFMSIAQKARALFRPRA